MTELGRSMARNAAVLAGFALASVYLVALTHRLTRDTIAAHEQAALETTLNALVPATRYDNALTRDTLQVGDRTAFGTEASATVYRARKAGQPVALLATVTAPDGYSGPIRLLVGVWADGRLSGVRVLVHRETPGLGDPIEAERSNWIFGFDGRSLGEPPVVAWRVKKDGGEFDQLTGATITPRAVVNAVRRFLEYERAHRAALYAATEAKP